MSREQHNIKRRFFEGILIDCNKRFKRNINHNTCAHCMSRKQCSVYKDWREEKNIYLKMNRYPFPTKKDVCKIVKEHHESMKDDPEHLTTEFIKKMINVDCHVDN